MSAKNARQKRKCKNKIDYGSKALAAKAMNFHVKKYQPNRKVNIYRCQYCEKWHIGHNRVRLK